MKKELPISDVLSVTDGHLVSRDHIGGVYNVCDFMTGTGNMTHQLPRVSEQIRPVILRQHPWLAEIAVPAWDFAQDDTAEQRKAVIFGWLDGIEAQYGATVELEALDTYDAPDPLEEACDLVGAEKVYVFPEIASR